MDFGERKAEVPKPGSEPALPGPGATDVWGQVIVCGGRMPGHILGGDPLDVRSTPPPVVMIRNVPRAAVCPLGDRITAT